MDRRTERMKLVSGALADIREQFNSRGIIVAARFYRQISQYLAPSGTNTTPLLPNQVRVLPNGLASVEKGLALLKAGEVHAEKLVYIISETPGVSKREAKA